MTQQPLPGPVAVVEKKKSRRPAVIAAAAVALALIAGGTYAAWTDSEWAASSLSAGNTASNKYNLKIADAGTPDALTAEGSASYKDTSNNSTGDCTGTADGPFEAANAVCAPINLGDLTNVQPGDSLTKSVYIKNDSTWASTLGATIVGDNSAWKSLVTVVLDVHASGGSKLETTAALAVGASDSDILNQAKLAAGDYVRVDITVTFDAEDSLNDDPTTVGNLQTAGAYVVKVQFTGSSTDAS
jgi:predicted ribosomally synthesized peptide with SipW-like signal peptide